MMFMFPLPPSVGEISLYAADAANISPFRPWNNPFIDRIASKLSNQVPCIEYEIVEYQLYTYHQCPNVFTPNPPHFRISGRSTASIPAHLQILGFQTQLPRIRAVHRLHISLVHSGNPGSVLLGKSIRNTFKL